LEPQPTRNRTGALDTRRDWGFTPGAELAPGLRAWALLGDGPRCETWLAWDVARWSAVAVKLPHPDQLGKGKAEAALARELATVSGLAHPAVQRLLDARLDAALPHLVYEYVEGPTLAAVLDEDGPMELVDVVLTGLQLAGTLTWLHGRGLVHLDVKPGNVVLRDGRAILIDFGITSAVGVPPAPGRVRGSPPYMAPEQEQRHPAAPSMDLFALGMLLHELATGRRPDPDGDGMGAGGGGEVAEVLPGALGRVVAALLEPEPADRPATASQVLRQLAEALPPGEPLEAEQPWPTWATPLLEVAERGVSSSAPAVAGTGGGGR
jgi:serine/threonine protein kinase